MHRLRFTRDALDPFNPTLAETFGEARDEEPRCIAFVDSGVAKAWPGIQDRVRMYASAHAGRIALVGPVRIVEGGEGAKNDMHVVDTTLEAVNEAGICRHSYVLAIGGGAMLDAVGFGAATAHRGVRLVRVPTTTLAQGDAGIGVKNGVNRFGKKNFIGSFAVPWAVVNDESFLTTLSDRDWRCGLSEAVKVALLKDAALFEEIRGVSARLAARDEAAASPIIRRSAVLHLEHICRGGDPFEFLHARPLDFGHWSAHRLEQMTGFRLRHGEAVAIGLAIDAAYSALVGLLPERDADGVIECLSALGFDVYDAALADRDAVLSGLEEFREHLGGRLTITLLKGVGRPIDVHEIDTAKMATAIERVGAAASRAG